MECRYKAALFDVGQTLICTSKSVGEFYAETAARYGVDVNPQNLNDAFRQLWTERRNALHSGTSEELERKWWYDLVNDVFACAGANCQPPQQDFQTRFDSFFAELFDFFTRAEAWSVFEDVFPAFEKLHEMGVRLAVLSNWDSRLETLLRNLELAPHFEFVLTSARAGFRKPDPRIFRVALDRLALPPQLVAHVGDSYEDDYAGAINAGLRPILIDRNQWCPAGIPTIRSLGELPGVLCGPDPAPGVQAPTSTAPAE